MRVYWRTHELTNTHIHMDVDRDAYVKFFLVFFFFKASM